MTVDTHAESTLFASRPHTTPPPRKFNVIEYEEYKDLPGMPKDIPNVTIVHYLCMLIPAMVFIILYVHHREQVARDQVAAEDEEKNIQKMLIFGTVFAAFVLCVHLQVIPSQIIRVFFPEYEQPTPMPINMKILVITCFALFIVYPTMKLIKDRLYRIPGPEVHRLKVFSSSYGKKYGTTYGTQ